MKNLVSVVIPTYKGANKLESAIKSILNQTYTSIEIIVVDDNDPTSEERKGTQELMSKYNMPNIIYIQHERNKNGSAARNTGIRAAKGEFICFLDDDDCYLPSRIEKSVAGLNKNQDFDAIYCSVVFTNVLNEVLGTVQAKKELVQKDILLNENIIGTGSNLFLRKESLDEIKGFDEGFRRHQDLEFLLRYLTKYKIINLDEVLIVKNINRTDNIPDYKNFIVIKELYWTKFKNVIERLNDTEKTQFYGQEYATLLQAAVKTEDKLYIREAITNLEKYRKLNIKEKIKVYLEVRPLIRNLAYKIFGLFSYLTKASYKKKRYSMLKKEIAESSILDRGNN
ncbi:glycosyltransferase family 2 protein [Paenibacillus sp. MMO-177]|uniref:glycosyltransferase family 2 protein n=1 Tax=Paenibacillus sp. MMO-177 TaxID=3081289 RepID=UPI003016F843